MYSIALLASAPSRSASSLCDEPKMSRKSLDKNLPSFCAAAAAIVSTVIGSRTQAARILWLDGRPPTRYWGIDLVQSELRRQCRPAMSLKYDDSACRRLNPFT